VHVRATVWGVLGAVLIALSGCAVIAPLEGIEASAEPPSSEPPMTTTARVREPPRGEGDPNTTPAAGRGRLTLKWVVDESTEDAACSERDVDLIHIVIMTVTGATVLTGEEGCELFRASYELPPASYVGTAVLLGFENPGPTRSAAAEPRAARTTVAEIELFTIFEGATHPVNLDFPMDSFF
jgi:hypothetical protein